MTSTSINRENQREITNGAGAILNGQIDAHGNDNVLQAQNKVRTESGLRAAPGATASTSRNWPP